MAAATITVLNSRDAGEFAIKTTWDNSPVNHDAVRITLSADPKGCRIDVVAPFFDSPPAPSVPAGQPCPELWEYEVVETFFLNDREQYLEVELCPHGQHLVLLLNGRRKMVQDELPLEFKSQVVGSEWHGSAVVPFSYLPPNVAKFNAFAIHGAGEGRVYEALFPALQQHSSPDFHRLEYFQPINLGLVSSSLTSSVPSELWNKYPPVV
ncbi:hypothetical protein BaRGS_00018905 [Batillaria attramentaria]|uniref:Uncharacterized protein n=1 Tax=Batillaria attramentaria TaxID=370345 RepID=A0ABD0KSE2_9CAEN